MLTELFHIRISTLQVIVILQLIQGVFLTDSDSTPTTKPERKGKYLYDYIPNPEINSEQNDFSRTIPTDLNRHHSAFNSPIYYIRLPPIPYSYIPGMGYVSQPPPSPSLVNLPLPFLGNGKPVTIYRWNGAPTFQTPFGTNTVPKPIQQDSTIHRLPGHFAFNGKPNDIFVLRDSYNALYDDALQNLYP